MNYPIKTNKIVADFNYSLIDEGYDIYAITNEKGFSKHAYILDSPLAENSVLSVCYTYGKSFYILLRKSDKNKYLIKTIIDNSKMSKDLTYDKTNSKEVYRNVLLQLFLNSIYSPKNEFLRFNNLTGHLYVFNPNLIARRKLKGKDIICQIPCVEVKVENNLSIQLNVRTFTSLKYKKQLELNNVDIPKYALSYGNTLRRKLSEDNLDVFVMRQFPGKKSEFCFLDLQNQERFFASKIGILAKVIELFNKSYSDIIKISFEEIENYKSIDCNSKQVKENHNIVSENLKKKNIKIIDFINDDYSKVFIKNIINLFREKYGTQVGIAKRVSAKNYNVCLIHNKAYYNGINDPHDIQYKDEAVQHITLEDFQDNAPSAISTIVHEILIKEDLVNKKISLFDWQVLGFNSALTFGQSVNDNGIERYFFMKIQKDGTFDISEQKLDLFNIDEYTELTNIFCDNAKYFEKVIGIVKDDKGNINIIRDTKQFTIPEFDKIKNELESGNTYLRNKDKRNELISACTDIKYFENNGSGHYFSGVIGNGMRAKVTNANNIRKIEAHNNSQLFFDKLIPLINVTFVRNNQLTVIPFPFKYLREYINKILSIE